MLDFGLHSTEWCVFAFAALALVVAVVEIGKIWLLAKSIDDLDKEP